MPEINVSKFQSFETETIHRGQLKGAEYNPRIISEANKRKLLNSLKKHGLVMPLVWNKRTGTLVSGHQRLKALDTLEGTDDYMLTVAVVDVSKRDEKIINVQINNEHAMGEWDLEALGELNLQDGITFDEMGFVEGDAALMFDGDERFTALFETPEAQEEKDTLGKIKEDRKNMMKSLQEEQTCDFYFVVVCRDQQDKIQHLKDLGYPPEEQYVHSEALKRISNKTF